MKSHIPEINTVDEISERKVEGEEPEFFDLKNLEHTEFICQSVRHEWEDY